MGIDHDHGSGRNFGHDLIRVLRFGIIEDILREIRDSVAFRHESRRSVFRRQVIDRPEGIARVGAIYRTSLELPIAVQGLMPSSEQSFPAIARA